MIRDYIAVDVETTGLNPARDRLLEIGAARILNGKVEATYQTFIDAGVEVPERITELTGITDEMRLSGKRPEQAIPEFLEFCGELPILGHNVSFDFGFLKQAAVNQGLTFEREALDTLKIARKLLPDLPSRRLPDLCAYYQVDPGNSHRALDVRYPHIFCCGICGKRSKRQLRKNLLFIRWCIRLRSRVLSRNHKKPT